ncbi:MAG: class I SAM-dependent methyltransferase [Parachlamydiaceae bacterium]|nr:class I SAM-dependent methyltransferase [Parachlamydiaceae bacterium]
MNIFLLLLLFLSFSVPPLWSYEKCAFSDMEKWTDFIEQLHQSSEGKVLKPFWAVETLVKKYLCQIESSTPVLDIGCETGKNSVCLTQAGHNVVLLDIAPNAITYTLELLEKLNLDHNIFNSVVGEIETLSEEHGPFKAVVGTYVFSFIPPEKFVQVMKSNVLGRVEQGGFFVGGFFGNEHAWANDPSLSITTCEELNELLNSMGFIIHELKEKKEEMSTVLDGKQLFHTIEIIAQRVGL